MELIGFFSSVCGSNVFGLSSGKHDDFFFVRPGNGTAIDQKGVSCDPVSMFLCSTIHIGRS